MISLGCSKNLVDSELILGCLRDAGFDITSDEKDADVIVVNTCGFIASAKEESINTILEAARDRKDGAKLVVSGCLSQGTPRNCAKVCPRLIYFGALASIRSLRTRYAHWSACSAAAHTAERVCYPRLNTAPISALRTGATTAAHIAQYR